MDVLRAKEILSVLVDGVNPITGEVLATHDSCNQVEVVRALYTAIGVLETVKPVEKPRQMSAGKPWKTAEEQGLIEAYKDGKNTNEIAIMHRRTRNAIAARLVRLGMEAGRKDVRQYTI